MVATIAAAAEDLLQLEEVTVTGRRVAEPRAALGASVVVLDGAFLDDFALNAPDDLSVAGVRFGLAASTDVQSIRGMQSGANFGMEQSAPCFLDGVWFGSSRCARTSLLDLEQVEVLKGPQPIHYGKGAIAGAFAMTSRRPTRGFDGELTAYHEVNHNESALGGVLNVPLGSRVATRLAGRWRNMDGYLLNRANGRMDPHQRDVMGRWSLRATPMDELTLDLKLEYVDNRSGALHQYVRCSPDAFTNPRLLNPAFEDCRMDRSRANRFSPGSFGPALALFGDLDRPGEQFRNQLTSSQAALAWQLRAGHMVRANVAYYDQRFHAWAKPDQSWNQRVLAAFDDSSRLVSQELRINSPAGGRWSWTAGAYRDDVARDNAPFTQVALPAPAGQARTTNWQEDSISAALFGEIAYGFTGAITGRLGGRHSLTRRRMVADLTVWTLSPNSAAPGDDQWSYAIPVSVTQTQFLATTQSRRDRSFTPAVSLEWRPREGSMYYAAWRKGTRPGGFSSFFSGPVDQLGFEPEDVAYVEAGLRLRGHNGNWEFGSAIFDAQYQDLQVPVVDTSSTSAAGVVVTRNAGGARSRGLDVDAAWIPAPGWRVAIAVYHLDSSYEEFRDASCYPTPAQTIAQGCVRVGGATLPPEATLCQGVPQVSCAQDLSGFPTSYAPRWSGNFSLRYGRALNARAFGSPLKANAMLEVMATNSYYTSVNGSPGSRQAAFAKLDALLAVGAADGRWELALVGRNLTDVIYGNWYEPLPGGGLNSGWSASTARPRQLGVQARLGF